MLQCARGSSVLCVSEKFAAWLLEFWGAESMGQPRSRDSETDHVISSQTLRSSRLIAISIAHCMIGVQCLLLAQVRSRPVSKPVMR